jgi:hypothetical protein
MICVSYVVMVQNIEERLRRIIDDVLDDSSDSESDIFVNSDSDNDSNYCASANEESTGKHHVSQTKFSSPLFANMCEQWFKIILFTLFQTQIQDHSVKLLKMHPVHLLPPHNHEREPGQH